VNNYSSRNSPNYDPEAPADGSANPPWWTLPQRPGKDFKPFDPNKPRWWMEEPRNFLQRRALRTRANSETPSPS